MSDPYQTFHHAGRTVHIYPDHDCEGPDGWDNAGTVVMDDRNVGFGDEQRRPEARWFSDTERAWEAETRLRRMRGEVVLPFYVSSHGPSWTVRATDDPDGASGIAYLTPAEIEEEWRGDRDAALDYLRARISEYAQWAEGDVWGYVIEDDAGNILDSVWSFYGIEYAMQEAREAAECHRAPAGAELAALLLPHPAPTTTQED